MDDEHKTKQQLIAELVALRQVFDGAGDAIGIVGLDGRMLEVNRTAHECLGYSHAEMLQMTLADIHPVDQAAMVAQRLAAARDQGSVRFETTRRRRDGTIFPVEVLARPVEFNGAPAVLCAARDITQHKRPEEALLRTLMDNVPLAVYVKDRHSRFVLANQGIAEVMGAGTPERLLGKTDFDFFPHDMAAGFYAGEQELMQSSRPVINHEESALDAAGQPRWFLNTAVPWHDAAGSIVGLVGVSQDVTERKRMEEALQRQSAALEELQASVLDITTPHELPALLQTVVERAARLLNVPAGGLYLCDAEHQEVHCVVSYNTLRDFRGTRLKYGEGAAGIVAQTGQPLIIDDYRTWSGRAGAFEQDSPFKALLSAPMTWQNRVIGVVHVMHNEEDRRFTREELELLSRFADHAAIAVENARLHERAQAEIAERKQTEETLRRERDFADSLVDTMQAIVLVLDPEGHIVRFNPYMEALSGYRLEEVRGKDWFSTFLPEDIRDLVRQLFATARGDVPTRGQVNPIITKDGRRLNIEWYDHTLKDPQGTLVGLLAFGQDVTERKQAEEALRSSQRTVELALEGADLGWFDWDMRSGEITINDRYATMLGYTREGLLPDIENWEQLVHPDDRPRVTAAFKREQAPPFPPFEEEYRMRTQDGGWKWIYDRGKVVEWDAAGMPLRTAGTHLDITERKRAEEVLREQKEILQTVLDNAPIMTEFSNSDGTLVWVNRTWEHVLGWSLADAQGRDMVQELYPDAEGRQRGLDFVTKADGTWEDFRLRRRDGTVIDTSWANVRLPEGTRVAIGLDVTERKRAEEALREQKDILQTVLDNAPIMTDFTKPDGTLLWVNRTWEHVLGWTLAHAQARDMFLEFYPDAGERQRALDFTAKADGNWQDFRIRRRDGALVDTSWANVRLPDAAIVGIGLDITERKQAEAEKERLQAQLLQSEKMEVVGQLAAGVAHDFNNLLTAILGFAELLQMSMAPDDRQHAMASQILTAGQRAAVLVNQLLGFARKQMIAPRELNLNDIVAGASATVRGGLEATIELITLPAPGLWAVRVDPEQFARVVHDLARNAARAMPGGGRLTIETANVTFSAEDVRARPEIQPGDYVLLAVGDTGAGMSREAAARVFEPFFFTSREVASGIGLRMAAVYGIVKQNHGYIDAESHEGAGTTVKVYLPRCEPPESA